MKDKPQDPIVPCVQSADIGGGLVAAIGILGAIIERSTNTGNEGQYIDVSMLDSVFSFMPMTAALHFSKYLNDGMIKNENILHGNCPYYNIYKTKDNKYLTVGAIEVKFWRDLCTGLGREDLKLKQMSQDEEREEVFHDVQKEFNTKTQKEWLEIFKDLDACVMPVKTFAEACDDPQIKARKMVVELDHPKFGKIPNIVSPIKYSRTPLPIRTLAPKVGLHTKEILKSLGYSIEDIKEFTQQGII